MIDCIFTLPLTMVRQLSRQIKPRNGCACFNFELVMSHRQSHRQSRHVSFHPQNFLTLSQFPLLKSAFLAGGSVDRPPESQIHSTHSVCAFIRQPRHQNMSWVNVGQAISRLCAKHIAFLDSASIGEIEMIIEYCATPYSIYLLCFSEFITSSIRPLTLKKRTATVGIPL
jgi:hypothetical protein